MSEQRVGIVTGGGRRWGMGWQIAIGLANQGLDLAIADIREDWGKEAAESIKAETGRRVIFVKTDVSKRDSAQAMAAKVIAEFGRVDVLVNDAAIDPGQPAEDFTDELFDRIMNVNLRGTALCCQAVIPQMRKQNYGRIVNISSGGAVQPVRGLAIYCASKAGVIAYSKVLAREVARDGIVVTVVGAGSDAHQDGPGNRGSPRRTLSGRGASNCSSARCIPPRLPRSWCWPPPIPATS